MAANANESSVRDGVRAALPLVLPVFAVAVSFGVLARPVMGALPAVVMSIVVFAGAAQFASLSVLAAGGTAGAAILAGRGRARSRDRVCADSRRGRRRARHHSKRRPADRTEAAMTAWLTTGALAFGTIAIKAAGPLALGRRQPSAAASAVIVLIAPSLLAALVVHETVHTGTHGLSFDARVVGLAAAAVALALRLPLVVVIAVAAAAAATARALT